MGTLGHASDLSPGCSGSQAGWGCCRARSCCRQAQSHDRSLASSCGIPAKTPEAAEGGQVSEKPAAVAWKQTHAFMSFTVMLGRSITSYTVTE